MIIQIEISKIVLDKIFDECDKWNQNETGGRLIGLYEKQEERELEDETYEEILTIKCGAMIGPGPNAQRSSTHFIQDGDWQEQQFRKMESKLPDIEHLGNWHTHHVNGLESLSKGDVDTYHRTVNHEKHNIDFFYALLVTKRLQTSDRYQVKHYVFFRNNTGYYEIRPGNISVHR